MVESLVETLEEVKALNRVDLLEDKAKRPPNMGTSFVPFITTYSVQHSGIRRLITKHWHILNNDPVLNSVLPARPQVVYKGAPSLRNRLAPNILNPPSKKKGFFEHLTGFYQCRRCRVCSINGCTNRLTLSFASTSTSCQYTIEPFVTCSTEGVVYPLQCPCGLQYVGRTRRPLSVHLN